MTITIELPPDVADWLTRKASQEGQDMAGYMQRLAVREVEGDADHAGLETRTPGLHAGWYWIADDFDAPLPDSFWLGAENGPNDLTAESAA